MSKIFGWQEVWSDKCDQEVKGEMFNGRKTFYLFWIPLYTKGFYHSTTYLGD